MQKSLGGYTWSIYVLKHKCNPSDLKRANKMWQTNSNFACYSARIITNIEVVLHYIMTNTKFI